MAGLAKESMSCQCGKLPEIARSRRSATPTRSPVQLTTDHGEGKTSGRPALARGPSGSSGGAAGSTDISYHIFFGGGGGGASSRALYATQVPTMRSQRLVMEPWLHFRSR